jgi:hypothetical protein
LSFSGCLVYAAHHNLPSPAGEIACLIDAILDIHGRNVGVIVVHFGNTPDYLDRFTKTHNKTESHSRFCLVCGLEKSMRSLISRKLQAEENHKLVKAHGNRPVIW